MNDLILLLIVEFFIVIIVFEYTTTMMDDKPISKEIYKSFFIGVLIAIIVYLYIKL